MQNRNENMTNQEKQRKLVEALGDYIARYV